MALASETNRLSYSGDGSTTEFPITFVFWQNADIRAVLRSAAGAETLWVLGTHYTLSGGSGSTGTLTATTAPASGTTLIVKSGRTLTQSLDLPSGGALPSTSIEQQLDIITRLIQQVREEVGRAPLLAETSSYSGLDLPDPSAGKYLRWNDGLDALENATPTNSTLSDPVPISSGGTNATTARAAWTNLVEGKPAFLAYNSATDANVTGDGTAVTLDFDTEVFDTGGNFAADTFTAPETGKYHFDVGVTLTGLNSTHTANLVLLELVTSNRLVRLAQFNPHGSVDAVNTVVTVTGSALVDMEANDTAFVRLTVSGWLKLVGLYGDGINNLNRFSGHQVS